MKSKQATSRCGRRIHTLPMTLVEMTFSLAIGALVFAILFSLLSQPVKLWHTSLALWQLDSQTRLVRETLLRGIDSQYGLREASLASLSIYPGNSENVEWMEFTVNTGNFDYDGIQSGSSTVTCRLLQNASNTLSVRINENDPEEIVRDPVTCETMDISRQGNRVTLNYVLSTTVAGQTYTSQTIIPVTLVNE